MPSPNGGFSSGVASAIILLRAWASSMALSREPTKARASHDHHSRSRAWQNAAAISCGMSAAKAGAAECTKSRKSHAIPGRIRIKIPSLKHSSAQPITPADKKAAIYRQRVTVDVARFRRQQEGDRGGDFLRLAIAALRHVAQPQSPLLGASAAAPPSAFRSAPAQRNSPARRDCRIPAPAPPTSA